MIKNFSVMQETVRVDISKGRSADIDANREVIFAVGDVHGCADLLDALLNAFGRVIVDEVLPRRLVFLGNLINRGPHTIKVLERWAQKEPIPGVKNRGTNGIGEVGACLGQPLASSSIVRP